MKKVIKLIPIFILSYSQIVFGQEPNNKQIEVAKVFLYNISKGNTDSCWALMDKDNIPGLTKEQFENAFLQLKNNLSIFNTFNFAMSGVKLINDKQLDFYSFKAKSDKKNIVDEVLVDVIFFKNSNLVAGIQPKQMMKEATASTSRAKETEIEKSIKITINQTEYDVIGINIVHFEKNEGLVAIQVKYNIPKGIENGQEWANKEGIKFAAYLVKSKYYELAKAKAKEIGLELLEAIGVSFLDPSIRGGMNTMIKPEEYNKVK